MRVGIVQSNSAPWRGYFDFIEDVDAFIVFDDVHYTDRDWRNRNDNCGVPQGHVGSARPQNQDSVAENAAFGRWIADQRGN